MEFVPMWARIGAAKCCEPVAEPDETEAGDERRDERAGNAPQPVEVGRLDVGVAVPDREQVPQAEQRRPDQRGAHDLETPA